MHSDLEYYIRTLARERGLNIAEVARRAGMSRQALYGIWKPGHYPSMGTIINLSRVLGVHPLSLLQQIFPAGLEPENQDIQQQNGPSTTTKQGTDRSAFIRDETFPDDTQVLAGSHFIKSWVLQNVGEQAWVDRYLLCRDTNVRLVSADSNDELEIAKPLQPDQNHIPIPKTLPGQTVTLSIGFTAPSIPATVISYWKMAFADGTLCFQNSRGIWVKVNIITPIGAASEIRTAEDLSDG